MTTVGVTVGFSGPALATAFRLDDATLGVLDTSVLAGGETAYDLSDRTVSLSVRRGRQELTEPVQAGRATLVFRNEDGVLDPQGTASPLYPGIEPRRGVAIFADGVQVFSGFVEDIQLDYTPGGAATVTVSAVDGLSEFAQAEFPVAGVAVSSQDSGARIGAVLASDVNLWNGDTAIDTGDSTLVAGTATGNVLEYLRQVEQSEAGFLFVSRTGVLTFKNRNEPAEEAGVVLSDTDGVPYETLRRDSGAADLFSRVQATAGTVLVEAANADALVNFGNRTLDLGELLLSSSAAQDRVDYEVGVRSRLVPSVREVTVSQSREVSVPVLGLDLGEAVTVEFSPPSVGQLVQTSVVQGVGHDWTVGGAWRTVLSTTPTEVLNVFILDSSEDGILDDNVLAF